MSNFAQEDLAADRLRELVWKRIDITKASELECPREGSFMTPCVARDGGLANADDGACVGCGQWASVLLVEEEAKHKP